MNYSAKPRAQWCPFGRGYWTVRTFVDGFCVQGVGGFLEAAYSDWALQELRRQTDLLA